MAARIPKELLEKIKNAVNLIEIAGEHVVLRKTGANYVGLCPFHSERSPSFSVSENKQLYHCYGCQRGGDLVRFVQEINGISFHEAVEELADRAKIQIPSTYTHSDDPNLSEQDRKKYAEKREKITKAHLLNRFVAVFYQKNIEANYFLRRGVSGDTLRNFYVGTAPDAWGALAQHLKNGKAPLDLARELGLIMPSKRDAGEFIDLFRNRAMFPIIDMRGKICGFGGRTLNADEKPKYLNSSESLIFQKSKILFGLFQAQKHIRASDESVLVEGYFDTTALHAAGFAQAVATCGTALSSDHLNVLKRLGNKITVLFDGDQAGITATDRAMETALEQGLIVYGAEMPKGLDPDEVLFDQKTGNLLKDGQERMKGILAAAKPLLDARIEQAGRYSQQGAEAKTTALKQVARWLTLYKDPVGREVRMQAAEQALRVPRSLLIQAMGGNQQPPSPPAQARPSAQPSPAHRWVMPTQAAAPRPFRALKRTEKLLLKFLVSDLASPQGRMAQLLPDTLKKLPEHCTWVDLLIHPEVRALFAEHQKAGFFPWQRSDSLFASALLTEPLRAILTEALIESPSAEILNALPADPNRPPPVLEEKAIKIALFQTIGEIWARFSHTIKIQLKQAEANKDADLHARLVKDFLDVQHKMKDFATFTNKEFGSAYDES